MNKHEIDNESLQSYEDRILTRNKRIAIISAIALSLLFMVCILFHSEPNDTIYFHFVHDRNTGESLGWFVSVFLYILLWWVIGMLPAGWNSILILILYMLLYPKNTQLRDKHFDVAYYGGWTALCSTYGAVLVLMILHLSNIITIDL